MRTRVILAAVGLGLAAFANGSAEVDEQGYEIVPVTMRTGSPEEIEKGRLVYVESCAQCHGTDGDGRGTMADFVYPVPRDFTAGTYKLRHTPAGELPTDDDLYAAIARGLPGTSMPAWEGSLTGDEIRAVVQYIKTFSDDFERFPPEEQVVIGKPAKSTPESIERGREIYDELQCAKCHGETGRGNGPSAPELKDDWGESIWPANLTQPWTFRGGATSEDIYRTFVTGLSGTPMPSYAPSIGADDAWHLVNYMQSLMRDPVREVVVRAMRVDSVPQEPAAEAWDQAAVVDFKMAGQIVQAPRLFKPLNDNITVQALYDAEEIAIRVTWDDRTENRGGDGVPPDQVAVQFPAGALSGTEKPYFLMGDRKNPVDYWLWSAATGEVQSLVARGSVDVSPGEAAVQVSSTFDEGRYRVVFRRAVETDREFDVRFERGVFVPVAFNLWDGANGEEGNRKTISAWYYLFLEPEASNTVLAWPLVVVFLGLGAEVLILRRVNRQSRGA